MLYAYIGAAAVVGLLIGFVTVSVIWLSKRVSEDIRGKTLELISTYDALLEDRSRELARLEEDLRQKSGTDSGKAAAAYSESAWSGISGRSMLNTAERIGSSAYRDAVFGENYRRIRNFLPLSPEAALEQLKAEVDIQAGGPATRLLSELSHDTIYQLSTLSGDVQRELLRDTVDEDGIALLDAYESTHRHFGAIEFYDYLQAVAAMEPQQPRLKVSSIDKGPYPEGVEVVVDPDICEGFQIEINNTLYDYSIKGRELS